MIKKLGLFLVLTFSCIQLLSADKDMMQEFDSFSDGVDTYHLPDKIKLTNLQDCLNLLTDEKIGLSRRKGNGLLGNCLFTSTRNVWRFVSPSNDEWLVRLDCRGNLIAGKSLTASGSCFSVCVSTHLIDTSVDTNADVGLGKLWLTNKVDGLMSWDGTTFTYYPDAPKASQIKIFRNRVILGDVSNEGSSLRLSGELNGSDFTTDSRFSTSPIRIPIGGVNDGNKVYGIHVGLDELLIFKAFSSFRLTGNDQRDFRVSVVSPEIGSIYPYTIAQRGLFTLFVSNRGLDSYRPAVAYMPSDPFTRLSDPIQNKLDFLSLAAATARNYQLVGGAWALGSMVPAESISYTLTPGSIRPNNHQQTDNDNTTFNQGIFATQGASFVSADGGQLVFHSTANPYVYNASFETDGGGTGIGGTVGDGWGAFFFSDQAGGPAVPCLTFLRSGNDPRTGTFNIHNDFQTEPAGITASMTGTARISIVDAATNQVLVSTAISLNVGVGSFPGYGQTTLFTDPYNGKYVYLALNANFVASNGQVAQSTVTSTSFYNYHLVSIYTNARIKSAGSVLNNFMDIDFDDADFAVRPSTDFNGSFISRTFDTTVANPVYDKLQSAFASSATTTNFYIRTSSDPSCCFGSELLTSTGATILNSPLRYVQYLTSFTVAASSTPQFSRITSVTLGAHASGYYQSPVQDLENIQSWGLFTADQNILSGGRVTYQVQSSSDGSLSSSGWVSQTLNAAVAAPVNRFIATRVIFDNVITATNVPTVNAVNYNWTVGGIGANPVAATYRGRYYLFYSTNTGSGVVNDQGLIFNRNNVFDIFGGMSVSAAAIYANQLVLGDANQTGNVYVVDGSTDDTDNGIPIQSYFKIKRFDGGEPDSYKVWNKVYYTLSRDDVSKSQIFNTEYVFDGSTNTFVGPNIELSTGTAMLNQQILLPITSQTQSKYMEVRFREITNGKRYYVSRMKVYATILPPE